MAIPNTAPRCGAKTRGKGNYKTPAMTNSRCHARAASTGPRTTGDLMLSKRAGLKHNIYSAKFKAELRYICDLVQTGKTVLSLLSF
jgi:hypothetical protein